MAGLPTLRRGLCSALLSLLAVLGGPPQAHAEAAAQHPPHSAERAQRLAAYAAEIRRIQARGELPIIDVEHHWGGRHPVEALIAKMDDNGVALTWLGQNEKNGSPRALAEAQKFPGRIVPATMHGDGPRWHERDPLLLEELARDARSGRYFALGEFRLAEETGLPMLLHHEAEDALLPELERMLTLHPGAKVIWCHVGRNRNRSTWTRISSPEGVRDFLRRYPNLHFDLNQARPGSRHRGTNQVDAVLYDTDPGKGADNQPDAKLNAQWQTLLEEFPERFLIGTDVNTGRFDEYSRVIETFRRLVLARLDRPTAERIAFKNAWRLMSGREWAD